MHWDAALLVNDSIGHQDPWAKDADKRHEQRGKIFEAWNALPETNGGWLEVHGVVAIENILDIDEIGDEYVSAPHIYAPFNSKRGPFDHFYVKLEGVDRWSRNTKYLADFKQNRVVKFLEAFRHRESGEE